MKSPSLFFASVCIMMSSLPAFGADFFVSPDGENVPPYNSWITAATNIQDAIDVAAKGDMVWVTNGIYASGGKGTPGDVLNRVMLNKALTVRSVNGPALTVIQGARDPATTNGPLAVRCAWLTNGASLSGFTLIGGATSSGGSKAYGGGVWGASTNATVDNCVIRNNTALYYGGGAYQVSLTKCWLVNNTLPSALRAGGGAAACGLNNCVLTGNSAYSSGGGAYHSLLRNCALTGNSAGEQGGGAIDSTLISCTLTANRVTGTSGGGGGAMTCSLINCIVYGNFFTSSSVAYQNQNGCTMSFCCSYPLPNGPGNIQADPELVGDPQLTRW